MSDTITIKTVKLSASLRDLAGAKAVDVQVQENATARDLLLALAQAHPELGERVLDADGQLGSGIQFMVGGRHIQWLQGLDTPVADARDFLLIPPISGG